MAHHRSLGGDNCLLEKSVGIRGRELQGLASLGQITCGYTGSRLVCTALEISSSPPLQKKVAKALSI